jgi:phosphoserine aminotransferase
LSMSRLLNFSAGPAILPVSVLEEAAAAVCDFNHSGMSVLELSHRGKHYDPIHAEALSLVLRTLNLSDAEYSVLFVGGGASLQFAMLPMNFLGAGETADYIDAGEWGKKAIAEAKRVGSVHIAGSSAASKYDRLPEISASESARYLHYTTNNTVEGTQVFTLPDAKGAPLVIDASSDIFGVDRDHSRFDLIYSGAQKNAGAAGVTFVVIKKAFLETASKTLSPMLSYKTQVETQSLYNTPPVFSIYVLGLVLKWIAAEGGVKAIATRNQRKASLIYAALDAASEIYAPAVAAASDRSWMNLTWRMQSEALETELLAEAKANGMDGLKGHRNVGGFRASIYNAFPESGCQTLADLLTDFANRKG